MWSSFPFLRIFLAFALGIICQGSSDLTLKLALVLFTVTMIPLLIGACHAPINMQVSLKSACLCLIFLGLGYARAHIENIEITNPNQNVKMSKQDWIGVVMSPPNSTSKWIKCVVKGLNQQSQISSWQAYLPNDEYVTIPNTGDTIIFQGELKKIKNAGNPNEFDQVSYYQAKGISHLIFAREWHIASRGEIKGWKYFKEEFQQHILSSLESIQNRDYQILIYAMLTGDKHELDSKLKRTFSQTGIIHILAVSGMHVGLLAAIPMWYLRRRKKKSGLRTMIVLIAVSIIWLYALLVGGSPSVIRSALMFTLFLFADHHRKQSQSLNLLCASGFFILLFQPDDLFSIGFQLSHLAVLGIVIGVPALSTWYLPSTKWMQFPFKAAYLSIGAQLATTPLALYYFNSFPTYFLLANLFVVPIFIVCIYLAIASIFLQFNLFIQQSILIVLEKMINVSMMITQYISELPWSTILVVNVSKLDVALCYAGIIIWFFRRHLAIDKQTVFSIACLFIVVHTLSTLMPKKELVVFSGTKEPLVAIRHGSNFHFIGDSSQTYFGTYSGYVQKNAEQEISWSKWLDNTLDNCEGLPFQGEEMILWNQYFVQKTATTNGWAIVIDSIYDSSANMHRDTFMWNLGLDGAFCLKAYEPWFGFSPPPSYKLPILVTHK